MGWLWIKLNAPPGLNSTCDLISKYDATGNNRSYLYRYQDAAGVKQFEVRISSDGTAANTSIGTLNHTLIAGAWTHLAFIYSPAGTVQIYVNGVAAGTISNLATTISDGTASLQIGRTPQGNDYLDGSVDEVRIWAVARTQAQIQSSMFNELIGTETGLKGYWKLNNSLADASGNGNTLTNINSAVFASHDLPFFDKALTLEWCSDRDTKGLWHLSNTTDASANGNTLANNNGAVFEPGRLGNAVSLMRSSSQYLSIADSVQTGLDISGDISIAAWIKPRSAVATNQFYPIAAKEDVDVQADRAYAFGLEDLGGQRRLGCRFHGNGYNVPWNYDLNVWYFVAVTREQSTCAIRFYVDGIQVGATIAGSAGPLNNSPGPFTIGARPNRGIMVDFIDATIDELRVVDRVLAAEEVMKYFGGIASARFTPLVDAVCQDDNNSQTGRTWAQVHDADGTQTRQQVGTGTTDGGIVCDKNNDSGSSFRMNRALFNLDTSALPNASIIVNHAAFNLYVTAKEDNQADSVAIGRHSSASNGSIVIADIDNLAVHGDAMQGEAALSGISTSAYHSFVFDSTGRAWVNQAGFTKLTARMGKDYKENSNHLNPPTSARNEFQFYRAGAASNRPYLLVEYTSGLTITGTVSFPGVVVGSIFVFAGTDSVHLDSPGIYSITVGTTGSTNVTAFFDTNGNNIYDPWEPVGAYPGNPISPTGTLSGIDIMLGPPTDTDHDGMSDTWEQANGLIVGVNDALLDKDNDGLTNIQEYYLVTNPSLNDSDADGVQDGLEFAAGMNLLSADSDGDGLPDAWETANGLNPLVNDAAGDADGDGLTNSQEYNGGVNSTNPRNRDSDSNGVSDYEQRNGVKLLKHLYDRNDRLVATQYDNGAWEGWRYDGNGNILRHLLRVARDADNDGLSDAWEFAQGLAIDSATGTQGSSGDADADGWTNQQEFLAGTSATDATSHPDAAASTGAAWFNPPKSRILTTPASGGALAHVSVRLWDAEANNASLALQWWDATASLWKPATLSKVNNAAPTTASALATSPTGTTHDLLWNAVADLPTYNGTILLRTTAQDPAGTTTSEAVPYSLSTTGDFDGDGMPDAWEIARGLDPNDATGANGSAADTDGDGLNNFGEFVFGLNLAAADAANAAVTSTAVNPADGKRYLTLTYRRRLDAAASGLTYTVQTSTDITIWTTNGLDVEAVGNAPSGDGVTELVTVRIKPPLDDSGVKKFARVLVTK